MNGILIVDKPAGWTSFDVIAKLRGILATRRIGHSGTLDPMATGVLPVFVGPAARAVDLQTDHTKEYVAGVRFGVATDTGDTTGAVLRTADVTVSKQALLAVLPSFMGEQQQLPPMYSAVKVNGQPLYKLARKGETVERTPRTITVFELELLEQTGENEYLLRIACSKGSYVRVLLEDIGAALGAPAAMCSLRRTRSGRYTLQGALTLEQIQRAKEDGSLQSLLAGVDTVFDALPAASVDARIIEKLKNGSPCRFAHPDGRLRIYDESGAFYGVAAVKENTLQVEKLFIER